MSRRLILPLLLPFCLVLRGAQARDNGTPPASSIPRAGAARALRLVDSNGRALPGSFSQAHWAVRGDGLLFTREWAGTRNIWRAAPDDRDKGRYPVWRAEAITHFVAPMYAADPSPLPNGKAVLCTSNATSPGAPGQIVQLELSNPSLRAITAMSGGASEPASSPNGRQFAFTSSGSGISAVYVQSSDGGAARRIPIIARHAAWQDNGTLLVESALSKGIFRLALNDLSHPVPLTRGGEASASGDGQLIAVTSNAGTAPEAQRLYILAGDGSGLRALSGTEGAYSPALAPDASVLAYDAPAGGINSPHLLWILPLEPDVPERAMNIDGGQRETVSTDTRANATTTSHRTVVDNPQTSDDSLANPVLSPELPQKPVVAAPTAQILGTKAAPHGGFTILGVIQGDGAVPTLEVGQGEAPSQWSGLPVAAPPIKNGPIATWVPPVKARGIWTLRLSVSNDGGAAQSFFTLKLSSDKAIPTPISSNSDTVLPSGGPLPPAPLPNLPAPPLPSLPPPAPLPTPKPKPAKTPRPTSAPTPYPTPTPAPVMPPLPRPIGQPLPPNFPAPTPAPTQRPVQTPPVPRLLPPTPSDSGAPNMSAGQDAATFNVSGTLATVNANQKITSTFWAFNKGSRGWDSGSGPQAAGAVRLIARWVDFDTGSRKKWVLFWMKRPVPPGQRTNWSFDLVAPSKPGRYKLIYGLVRVPSSNWQPPPYNASQVTWPGEFAAIAFAVTVK